MPGHSKKQILTFVQEDWEKLAVKYFIKNIFT